MKKSFLAGVVGILTIGSAFAIDPTPGPFLFTDITTEADLAKLTYGSFVHAIAWGDYDSDGRLDLFVGTFGERGSAKNYGHDKAPRNMLLRQDAAGKFTKVSAPALELAARCSGAVFADLDNDGAVDLYVSSNRWESPSDDAYKRPAQDQTCRLYRNRNGDFLDVTQTCGACLPLYRCRDIGVFDYDNDGLLDLLVLQDTVVKKQEQIFGSRLFRNLGNFRFEDVTARTGLPPDLAGFGVAVADLNGDRRPDFYVCGANKLYLSQRGHTYKEAEALRAVFDHRGKELDSVTGAAFGDLDLDGDFDLITGPHNYHGPSRVHVFLNEGISAGVPRFREVTRELGIPALPQKSPHPEINDFDNDGLPDLYWSVFYAAGKERRPFICRGTGVKAGLPRFDVPPLPPFSEEVLKSNVPPEKGECVVYYVASPAVDYDNDGDLDLFCGNWPPEMCRLFRNDTRAGNWLQVRVQGSKMNRMGVGAQVKIYPAGTRSKTTPTLLGMQEITLNGGYSSSRPAVVHFGLGTATACDVEVILPASVEPIVLSNVAANQLKVIREP